MSIFMKNSGFRAQLETLLVHLYWAASLLLCISTAFVSVGCGEHQASPPQLQPVEALRSRFPDHASRVLHGSDKLVAVGDGFAPSISSVDLAAAPGRRGGLSAALPKRAEEAIRFHRMGGFEFRVHESGASGEGSLVEGAVAYPRQGGTCFWTATEIGYEEWLLLDAGIATGREPVATWEIEGARANQVDGAIEIVGEDGAAYLRVTAPAAFAAEGRRVDARLAVHGARIELWVDAGGEAVLVDPVWMSAGFMNTGRRQHAAVRLTNGKVLVMGGQTGSQNSTTEVASAELYDPSHDTWAPAGTMSIGRVEPTATLLSDGRVLVVGGANLGVALASTDLYDPLTNSWTPGPPVSVTRWGHSAILLPSGKVLVVGGAAMLSSPSAELFDPSTNTWTSAGSTVANLAHPGLVLLSDGKVLRAGGSGSTDADVYNPVTNAWSPVASMTIARTDNTLTMLPNGKVLSAGGRGPGPYTIAEVYDPSLNTWTQTPPMSAERSYGHVAAVLPNGKVLLVGGFNGATFQLLTSTDLYDPATNTWSSAGSLPAGRWYPTATLLLSGRVLIAGGWNGADSNPFLSSSELFDPAANVWTSTASMSTGRTAHTATPLQGGKVLVVGGYHASGSSSPAYLDAAEIYDPSTNTWASAAAIPGARAYHTATLLQNGKVLVAGGQNGSTSYLGSVYIYDPVSNTWTAAAQLPSRRSQHSATLLASGRVLVVGGNRASWTVYDPITSTWSSEASMPSARYRHAATLLSSGNVLVTGGNDSTNVPIASAEIYDPATNAFTSASTMNGARALHTATLLPNGKVLVAGGLGTSGVLATAEIYSPTTNSWVSAASMSSSRDSQTATLLQSGFVLMAGGFSGSNHVSSAEIYDSAANTWFTTPSMSTARSSHTATLLGSDKVLLAGGENNVTIGLVSSELYGVVVTDDGKPCTMDVWNTSLARVTHTNLANGTACSDGNVCTQGDTCQAGVCTGGSMIVIDDSNPCTVDHCDPVLGVTHVPSPVGTSCDNSSVCDGLEVCDGSGVCLAGTAIAVDDYDPCTLDHCDPVTGIVTHPPSPIGTSCANSSLCDGLEVCNGSGVCMAGTPLNTDDGDLCTTDSCDPVLGVLHVAVDVADLSPTTIDRCDPATGIISHTTCAPLDPTVATRLYEAAACIYDGPQQIGRTAILDPVTISVLQGKVLTRAGTRLSGVKVSVLHYAENNPQSYGWTFTGSDGAFELAVNGGSTMTLQYEKTGYLPVQRQVEAVWQHYAVAPDVVMLQLDPQVTSVTLSSGGVARGSVQTDTEGTRQATVLFPASMTGTMTVPDPNGPPGSTITSALPDTVTFRATEYTVGANGPQAMPGPLPPTSGYTYAVDLVLDEAIAAGATTVSFDKKIPFYVDNFLNFPVGSAVPVGYYDRLKAAWIPSDNGIVIKIGAPSAGMASVEIDNTGIARTWGDTGLSSLEFTQAELQRLAQLYVPGKSLWRSLVTHFTPYDCNYPNGPEPGACDPGEPSCGPGPGPDPNRPNPRRPKDDPCTASGSIIECENQILGERLAVSGTPFTLNYRSDRVVGRKEAYHLDIPVTGTVAPPSVLKRIEVVVTVAGKKFDYSVPCSPCVAGQKVPFDWDGEDLFGRKLQGLQIANIAVGYVYNTRYMAAALAQKSFGVPSSTPIVGPLMRTEFPLWVSWEERIGAWSNTADGLGGWSLSEHHAYDSTNRILYKGDGSRRGANSIPPMMGLVAGGLSGTPASGLADIPVADANLQGINAVASGPDGTYYTLDGDPRVRKITKDGIVQTVAGVDGTSGAFNGDGLDAALAQLSAPVSLAVGADGSLFIADRGQNRVRKLRSDNTVVTVAGNGTGLINNGGPDFQQDDVLATSTAVGDIRSIALSADGSLYITTALRIRRVGPDGMISTVVGGGADLGDGIPATQAAIASNGIAVSGDGSIYFTDRNSSNQNKIRRVSPNGIVSTFAGTGVPGYTGDGGLATAAQLNSPRALAIDPEGSVYAVVNGASNTVIRRIRADGMISTVAGNGNAGGSPTCYVAGRCFGVPATLPIMSQSRGLAFTKDGDLLISVNDYPGWLVNVGQALPGLSASNIIVPSETGAELYVFDSRGKHLTTRDGRQGYVRRQFSYGVSGELSGVTDFSGSDPAGIQTSFLRDPVSGVITIVPRANVGGPAGGPATQLSLDSEGYLESVMDPVGATTQFTYHLGTGLLKTLIDPELFQHSFLYDLSTGRLTKDSDPAGGYKLLSRVDGAAGYTVSITTAMNRTTTHQVTTAAGGDETRTHTAPGVLATAVSIAPDGTRTTTFPDQSTQSTTLIGDPRFGLQVPIVGKEVLTIPAETSDPNLPTPNLPKSKTTTRTRAVTLSNPSDVSSVVSLSDTVSVNGKTSTRVFTKLNNTVVTTTPVGREVTTVLDAKGHVVQLQVPGFLTKYLDYYPDGQLSHSWRGPVGTGDRMWSFAYDPSTGYLSEVTNPLLQSTSFLRDLAGRVTEEQGPGAISIVGSYDGNGQISTISPPGQPAHGFTYTPAGLLYEYTPPDVGAGAQAEVKGYDLDHFLTDTERLDSGHIVYDRDLITGRLKSVNGVTLPWGMGALGYNYNSSTGKVSSISGPSAIAVAFKYQGPHLVERKWSGVGFAAPMAVHQDHNDRFLISTETVNGANAVAYLYDDDGLLTNAGGLTIARSSQNGSVVGSVMNNVSDVVTYNSYGEIDDYTADYASSHYSVSYALRDDLGRIKRLDEALVEGTTSSSSVYEYDYDSMGHLSNVKKDGVLVGHYGYDSNGNRTTCTSQSVIVTPIVYDAQDRLKTYGDTTYEYTEDGELSKRQRQAHLQR